MSSGLSILAPGFWSICHRSPTVDPPTWIFSYFFCPPDVDSAMDGRGRALDNVFIERLWRSLKYELIYPGDLASGLELFRRWRTTSASAITGVRTRRSAIRRRQTCSRTSPKGTGHSLDGGRRPPNPLE